MIINFIPVYTDTMTRLKTISVKGQTITINGEPFDFSPLGNGYELPQDAIGSEFFADKAIMSEDGVLTVSLFMPYDETVATQAIRFPDPVVMKSDGPVDIPTDHPADPVFVPEPEEDEEAHGLLEE